MPPTSVMRYAQPDYTDITITPGRHTIKVQNLGGMNFFDEIKITAKANAGVENVTVDQSDAFSGNPIYFDLNGRRVNNPANGIFIVKRGNSITKEILR